MFKRVRSSIVRGAAACLTAAICLSTTLVSTVGAADRRDFRVYNNTGKAIYELYVSPHDKESWEEDVLADDVLLNGQSVMIRFHGSVSTCMYDFRLKFRDGRTQEYTNGRNLCRSESVQFNRYDVE